MQMIKEGDEPLGDRVYGSFDGWNIKIYAANEAGEVHSAINLSPICIALLIGWLQRVRPAQFEHINEASEKPPLLQVQR